MNSFLINLPAEVLRRSDADRPESPAGERTERGMAAWLAIAAVLAAAVAAAF